MLKSLLLLAAATLGGGPDATVAGETVAAQAAVHPLDVFVAEVRRQLPKDFGEGVRMVEVRRENNVAIVIVEAPREIATAITPQEFGAAVAQGFCEGGAPERFFEGGNRLRIDMRLTGGETIPGEPIDSCPG